MADGEDGEGDEDDDEDDYEERLLRLEEEVEYYKGALEEAQDRFHQGDMLFIKDLKEENSKLGRDHRVLQYKYR